MNNDEWVIAWRGASRSEQYALVERLARKALPAEPISTNALAELLLPELSVRGFGIDVRKGIIACLMRMAKGTMADCATKDMECAPRLWYGKQVRPWLWKSGTAKIRERCPHCHGKGYLAEADRCQGLDKRSAVLDMSESDTETTRQEEIKQDMAQTIA